MKNAAIRFLGATIAAALCAAPAMAQDHGKKSDTEKVEDIAAQPARDVGVVKTRVPPLLQQAARDPYGLNGLSSCASIASAMRDLDGVLGPDLGGGTAKKGGVKVDGDTVAGVVVPFRGLVREVSGAASAQRELNAAMDAGFARRGYLRGVYTTRKCKPAL